jgi:hypothetical protein
MTAPARGLQPVNGLSALGARDELHRAWGPYGALISSAKYVR